MTTAERNRAIKRVLVERFGRGNVSVTGSRGTAYGWVRVFVNVTPRDREHWRELYSEVHALISKAGIPLSTYYADDGYGTRHSCMNVSFAS